MARVIETLLKFLHLKCQQDSLKGGAEGRGHPGNTNTPTSMAYKSKTLGPSKQPMMNYFLSRCFFPAHTHPQLGNKEKLWKVRELNVICIRNSPRKVKGAEPGRLSCEKTDTEKGGGNCSASEKQELKIPLPHVIYKCKGCADNTMIRLHLIHIFPQRFNTA